MGMEEEALEALILTWRLRAKADARYGVGKALASHREYFGTVNAAYAVDECADELEAVLARVAVEERIDAALERGAKYLEKQCEVCHRIAVTTAECCDSPHGSPYKRPEDRVAQTHPSWCVCERCRRQPIGGR